MKKLNYVLLCLGFAFLIFLIWKLGPAELWREVSALGWGVTALILAEGAANLAHTLGWRHCIDDPQGRLPLLRLFGMAMAGYGINYLTPTCSVGGDVSRAALLTSTQSGPEAASSVVLDKLMTGLAHVLLVTGGAMFLFWTVKLPLGLWVAMVVTGGLIAGGLTAFLLLQKQGRLGGLCRWLVDHNLGGRLVERAAQQISRVDELLKRFYRERPRSLMLSVAWHLIGHSVALLHVWLFLRLLDQPAPLVTVVSAGFLSLWFDLLTFAVPMNLGTLEGSRIIVLKSLGCEALLGMAFGVAIRITQLFWASFGLVSYALMARGRAASKPKPADQANANPLTGTCEQE